MTPGGIVLMSMPPGSWVASRDLRLDMDVRHGCTDVAQNGRATGAACLVGTLTEIGLAERCQQCQSSLQAQLRRPKAREQVHDSRRPQAASRDDAGHDGEVLLPGRAPASCSSYCSLPLALALPRSLTPLRRHPGHTNQRPGGRSAQGPDQVHTGVHQDLSRYQRCVRA